MLREKHLVSRHPSFITFITNTDTNTRAIHAIGYFPDTSWLTSLVWNKDSRTLYVEALPINYRRIAIYPREYSYRLVLVLTIFSYFIGFRLRCTISKTQTPPPALDITKQMAFSGSSSRTLAHGSKMDGTGIPHNGNGNLGRVQ
jgi:hypothetical protein